MKRSLLLSLPCLLCGNVERRQRNWNKKVKLLTWINCKLRRHCKAKYCIIKSEKTQEKHIRTQRPTHLKYGLLKLFSFTDRESRPTTGISLPSVVDYIDDITRWREDMNFMFEWQEQYLTSKRSERVRYCSCHEKYRIFCLLYKRTNDDFFYDFPKISEHFPKISEDSPKIIRKPDKRFRIFSEHFRRFPKITEDFRGRSDYVSITQ